MSADVKVLREGIVVALLQPTVALAGVAFAYACVCFKLVFVVVCSASFVTVVSSLTNAFAVVAAWAHSLLPWPFGSPLMLAAEGVMASPFCGTLSRSHGQMLCRRVAQADTSPL